MKMNIPQHTYYIHTTLIPIFTNLPSSAVGPVVFDVLWSKVPRPTQRKCDAVGWRIQPTLPFRGWISLVLFWRNMVSYK